MEASWTTLRASLNVSLEIKLRLRVWEGIEIVVYFLESKHACFKPISSKPNISCECVGPCGVSSKLVYIEIHIERTNKNCQGIA